MANYNITIICCSFVLMAAAGTVGVVSIGTVIVQKILVSAIQSTMQQAFDGLSKNFIDPIRESLLGDTTFNRQSALRRIDDVGRIEVNDKNCASMQFHKFCPNDRVRDSTTGRANGGTLFELTERGYWNMCYEYNTNNFTKDLCQVFDGCIIQQDPEICSKNTVQISFWNPLGADNDTLRAILAPSHIFILDPIREPSPVGGGDNGNNNDGSVKAAVRHPVREPVMITWIFGENTTCIVDQATIGYVITELCFMV